jgi:hypothetical protein
MGPSSNSKPPANVMFAIGSPDASRGVWQLPQAATVVTRYAPHSTNVSADPAPPVTATTTAAPTAAAAGRVLVTTRIAYPCR